MIKLNILPRHLLVSFLLGHVTIWVLLPYLSFVMVQVLLSSSIVLDHVFAIIRLCSLIKTRSSQISLRLRSFYQVYLNQGNIWLSVVCLQVQAYMMGPSILTIHTHAFPFCARTLKSAWFSNQVIMSQLVTMVYAHVNVNKRPMRFAQRFFNLILLMLWSFNSTTVMLVVLSMFVMVLVVQCHLTCSRKISLKINTHARCILCAHIVQLNVIVILIQRTGLVIGFSQTIIHLSFQRIHFTILRMPISLA